MKQVVMKRVQFEGELIQGHKGVTVVLVPFNPEEKWALKPVRLAGRRHGWIVAATANGVAFDGFIGERWNRFFIILEKDLRESAKLIIGDTIQMTIRPTSSVEALLKAMEQSKVTTQPKTPRPDVIIHTQV